VGTASDLFFGLSAAFGYGGGDFLARSASQRVGYLRVLFYMEVVSLLVMVPLALAFEGDRWRLTVALAAIPVLAVVNLFASLYLYRAIEYGVLSVVSPLISSFPAVTAALAILFLGDRPPPTAATGIVAALVGIVLLSRSGTHPENPPPKNARVGLISAILSFSGYGIFYFALKYAVVDFGPITSVTFIRITGLAVLVLASLAGIVRLEGPPRDVWPTLAAMSLLDTFGFLAYSVGIVSGSVAIIGTLSGLFSAVTVGLAAIFLRERLTRIQYGGMAAIFLGVVLMAVR
jgi:drug/metabolite transporter (DMT)-like permease